MTRKRIKVLLIEDDPLFAKLARQVLTRRGGIPVDLECASRLSAGLECLAKDRVDAILLDLNLPDSSGLETLARVQAAAGAVPIVVLTGLDNNELAAQAVREGAQDFVAKSDMDGRLLSRALRYAIERKRAEEALKASEVRYRRLFESAQDGILILDAETGTIVDVNPFLIELLGMSHETFIGKKVWELGAFKDIIANQAQLAELQQKNYIRYEDMPIETADGQQVDVEFVNNVYLVNQQKVIQCNIRSITARKQAEKQMAGLEEQLRQAQKMEAIGQLAGGVAHDFNNMLFIINGQAELILNRLKPNDPLRSRLELICKTGRRAANLTRQLLAFSRRQVLQPKVLDLNAVISDLEKMLRRLIREDIAFTTSLEPKLRTTKADPGQLAQVIMNLVVNARDAMPQGGKLTIETQNVELDEAYCRHRPNATPGSYVMLAVSDTGCGMDEYVKTHIFEPFFTTKEQGYGTGLGLATVYGIVKQSGGNIEVYSELGKGTTFKVYLPQVWGQPERMSRQVLTRPCRGQETILLVEDEADVLALVRDILDASGYTVLPAANGAEALKVMGQHKGRIHLAVSDVIMPGMNGPELAQQLVSRIPDIKILFMSGYADHAIAGQGRLMPDANFIQKPVTPGDLSHKVREVLDGV